MSDTHDPVAAALEALRGLDDSQLRSVVAAATGGRMELAAVHEAAAAEHAEGDVVVVEPVDMGPGSHPAPSAAGAIQGVAAPVPSAEALDPGFTPGGVPTFEGVRGRIEERVTKSLGAQELDAETPEGRSVEEQWEARSSAARDRLDQIRKLMRGG